VLNSVTAFAGLSAGTVGAGVLVTFAPVPEQLVFIVLLVASVMEAAILWYMPETAELRRGALASLRPRVRVPPAARSTFASITPVNIAAWALGGFYFSLMPAVVRMATGATLPVVGGIVVAALTFAGAVVVVALRKIAPQRDFSSDLVSTSGATPRNPYCPSQTHLRCDRLPNAHEADAVLVCIIYMAFFDYAYA